MHAANRFDLARQIQRFARSLNDWIKLTLDCYSGKAGKGVLQTDSKDSIKCREKPIQKWTMGVAIVDLESASLVIVVLFGP